MGRLPAAPVNLRQSRQYIVEQCFVAGGLTEQFTATVSPQGFDQFGDKCASVIAEAFWCRFLGKVIQKIIQVEIYRYESPL